MNSKKKPLPKIYNSKEDPSAEGDFVEMEFRGFKFPLRKGEVLGWETLNRHEKSEQIKKMQKLIKIGRIIVTYTAEGKVRFEKKLKNNGFEI